MNSYPRMHVSLYVANINKTVEFYQSFFGKKADKVKDDYAKFILDKPSLIISFVQNAEKVSSNFGHLGFQVETENELTDKLELAKTNNHVFLEEVGTNCCYATQDKFWAKDPDGYMWEVYFFHTDSEFNDPRYEDQGAVACCTPEKDLSAGQAGEKPKLVLSDINIIGESCEPGSGCC